MSVFGFTPARFVFYGLSNTLFLFLKNYGRPQKTDFRFGINIEKYANKRNNFFRTLLNSSITFISFEQSNKAIKTKLRVLEANNNALALSAEFMQASGQWMLLASECPDNAT